MMPSKIQQNMKCFVSVVIFLASLPVLHNAELVGFTQHLYEGFLQGFTSRTSLIFAAASRPPLICRSSLRIARLRGGGDAFVGRDFFDDDDDLNRPESDLVIAIHSYSVYSC